MGVSNPLTFRDDLVRFAQVLWVLTGWSRLYRIVAKHLFEKNPVRLAPIGVFLCEKGFGVV